MRHVAITIIVAAFVALAALYGAVVPLGEGPDEPGHAAYVFFLARERRLPTQADVPGEGHQPPLAYALMAPLVAWLPPDQRTFDLPGNPRLTWAGGSELNAAAHGSRERWPWRGEVLAWHMARLVSVALSAATVVLTYLAAKALNCRLQIVDCRLGRGQSTIYNLQSASPLLAAALVAFNPQFLFVSALITNDALLTTLSAALLWLVVRNAEPRNGGRAEGRLIERRYVIGNTLAIGAVLGLALITKQSAIILVPVAALSVLEQSFATERTRAGGARSFTLSPRHPSASLRASLVTLSVFLAVTLLICGWWYARNLRLYGDLFGLAAFRAEFATQPFDAGSLAAWRGALVQLHASFWARFGWMNVRPPRWVIWLFAAVELAALAGLARLGIAGRRSQVAGRRWSFVGHWALVILPLLAFAWVVSFALTVGLVAWQGRLLFPALPAIAILMAIGLGRWAMGDGRWARRLAPLASRLLPIALAAIAAWLPFGVIRPAYPFHTLPEREALARLGTPIYGRYGQFREPGAELLGWQVAETARPGGTLDLTLMWHARARQNRDWSVFVHLVDADERIVAQDNRPPQDGAFPMTQWVAGDWIEDRHPITLPADLAPGTYALHVGLFDPRAGDRTGVYSKRGKLLGDYLTLGKVTVEVGG
ncbi:MAG TPA: hypothetical protein VF897_12790 [Roseiflexaceae bacterium]